MTPPVDQNGLIETRVAHSSAPTAEAVLPLVSCSPTFSWRRFPAQLAATNGASFLILSVSLSTSCPPNGRHAKAEQLKSSRARPSARRTGDRWHVKVMIGSFLILP
jgi:hypothetical protein